MFHPDCAFYCILYLTLYKEQFSCVTYTTVRISGAEGIQFPAKGHVDVLQELGIEPLTLQLENNFLFTGPNFLFKSQLKQY